MLALELHHQRARDHSEPAIFARSVISSSVMPSAKYSCAGSPERFSSGSTAIERIAGARAPTGDHTELRPIHFHVEMPTIAMNSNPPTPIASLRRFDRSALVDDPNGDRGWPGTSRPSTHRRESAAPHSSDASRRGPARGTRACCGSLDRRVPRNNNSPGEPAHETAMRYSLRRRAQTCRRRRCRQRESDPQAELRVIDQCRLQLARAIDRIDGAVKARNGAVADLANQSAIEKRIHRAPALRCSAPYAKPRARRAHERRVADDIANIIAASSRVGFGAKVSDELVTEASPSIASGRNRKRPDRSVPATARRSFPAPLWKSESFRRGRRKGSCDSERMNCDVQQRLDRRAVKHLQNEASKPLGLPHCTSISVTNCNI